MGARTAVLLALFVGAAWSQEPDPGARFRVRLLGEVPRGTALKSFSADPELSRIAFVVQSGPHQAVTIDGKEVARGKAVHPVRWAPTGGRWACTVTDETGQSVLLDGKRGETYAQVGELVFSKDGKRFAHSAQLGENRSAVVLDGVRQKEFERVERLVFSGDGKRFGYVGRKGEESVAVVEGVETGSGVMSLDLSEEGRAVAILAGPQGSSVVVDGRATKTYRRISRPVLSPRGGRVAFEAHEGGMVTLVVDGKPVESIDSGTASPYSIAFSPDGRRVAWLVEPTGKSPVLIVDGVRQEAFPRVSHFPMTFSPDGNRIAYVAREGSDFMAVVDGKPSPPETVILSPMLFSPDGRRTAYVARDRNHRQFVVVDGKPGPRHAEVRDPTFSPDGSALAYVARDGAQLWRKAYREDPVARRDEEPKPPAAAPAEPGPVDAAGDPMPAGFKARLGPGRLYQPPYGSRAGLAFSPDGKTLVSVGGDRTVRLWDVGTGKATRAWMGHTGFPEVAEFSPDGRLLATGSGDRTVRLWEVQSGRTLAVLRGHTGQLTSLSFSPDSMKLVTATHGPDPRLWDVETGKEIFRLPRHGEFLPKAVFSSDGKTIYTRPSHGPGLFAWSAADGTAIPDVAGRAPALSELALSPRGQYLVGHGVPMGRGATRLQVIDIAAGKAQSTFDVELDWRLMIGWSSDENTIAVVGRGGIVTIRDRQTGRERHSLRIGETSRVDAIALSPDGAILAILSAGFVRLWDLSTGRERFDGRHTGAVLAVVYSPDGRVLATAGTDYRVCLWERASGRLLAALGPSLRDIGEPAFLPDGKGLVTLDGERGIRVSDPATGKELRTIPVFLRSGAGPLACSRVGLSPDGKRAALFWPERGSWLLVLDLESGKTLLEGSAKGLLNENDGIASVLFSGDGKTIVTAGYKAAIAWNAETAQPWLPFETGKDVGTRSIFAPGGAMIVAGAMDGTVRSWEVQNGKQARSMKANKVWISALAFSPDGRLLVTAGEQKFLKFWDWKAGTEIPFGAVAPGLVRSLAFSPDGVEGAAGGDDGAVLLFDVPREARR